MRKFKIKMERTVTHFYTLLADNEEEAKKKFIDWNSEGIEYEGEEPSLNQDETISDIWEV